MDTLLNESPDNHAKEIREIVTNGDYYQNKQHYFSVRAQQNWEKIRSSTDKQNSKARWLELLVTPWQVGAFAAIAVFITVSAYFIVKQDTIREPSSVIALRGTFTQNINSDLSLDGVSIDNLTIDESSDEINIAFSEGILTVAYRPNTRRKPLNIISGQITVSVTGTKFRVQTDTSSTGVKVFEGRVKVTAPESQAILLSTGEEYRYSAAKLAPSIPKTSRYSIPVREVAEHELEQHDDK